MKIRRPVGAGEDKIELQMTPMIDIVFQMLVFFIMTFKIVAMEGDFNIKMPVGFREGPPPEQQLPPMRLRMRADGQGELASMSMAENKFSGGDRFSKLQSHIIRFIGTDTGPGSRQATAEIELDCDPHLRYEYVIEAITAVSGYVENKRVVKLVEKIKFAPPRKRS